MSLCFILNVLALYRKKYISSVVTNSDLPIVVEPFEEKITQLKKILTHKNITISCLDSKKQHHYPCIRVTNINLPIVVETIEAQSIINLPIVVEPVEAQTINDLHVKAQTIIAPPITVEPIEAPIEAQTNDPPTVVPESTEA